jgi:hypothetical protein
MWWTYSNAKRNDKGTLLEPNVLDRLLALVHLVGLALQSWMRKLIVT